MTLLIVPDTNVLFTDLFLEGSLIRTILAAETHTDLRLVVPEVVLDELRGHVEQELKTTAASAAKLRRDVASLMGTDPHSIDLILDAHQTQYVLDRFDQTVQRLDSEDRILSYPTVSLKELAQRSIAVQAPFQEKDRGLRDTLIWLTVKKYLVNAKATGTKVTLVTGDRAFWDKSKTKLNEELERELTCAGVHHDSVVVQLKLSEVIETLIPHELPAAEWATTAIEDNVIEDLVSNSEEVLLKVVDWLYAIPEVFEEPYGPISGYLWVEFDVVEEVRFEEIKRIRDLGNGEILVDSRWTCEAAVQGYDNPVFSDSLEISLQFTLSTIAVSMGDCLSVQSHEVTDAEVVDFMQAEAVSWRDSLEN